MLAAGAGKPATRGLSEHVVRPLITLTIGTHGTMPSHSSPNTMTMPPSDALIAAADSALRTLFVKPQASQACPTVPEHHDDGALTPEEKHLSGALMRVNHVGEVCAQALYTAQALAAR